MPLVHCQARCDRCNRNVMAQRDEPLHFFHFFVSFVTLGLWLPVWAYIAWHAEPWMCPHCGDEVD